MDRDELRLELLKLTLRGATSSDVAVAEVKRIETELFPEEKARSPLTLPKKADKPA